MKLKIFTGILFIIPLIFAFWEKFYIYSAIITFSFLSTMLYHLHNEKKFIILDEIASTILIITNLYFIYLSNFNFPFFQLAIIASLVSFYFWFRAQKTNYDLNHSWWHIAGVLITIFCILAYY